MKYNAELVNATFDRLRHEGWVVADLNPWDQIIKYHFNRRCPFGWWTFDFNKIVPTTGFPEYRDIVDLLWAFEAERRDFQRALVSEYRPLDLLWKIQSVNNQAVGLSETASFWRNETRRLSYPGNLIEGWTAQDEIEYLGSFHN